MHFTTALTGHMTILRFPIVSRPMLGPEVVATVLCQDLILRRCLTRPAGDITMFGMEWR